MNTHAIHRTSPKGEKFMGTCSKCGETGLAIGDALKECQNVRGTTFEQDLLEALGVSPEE